MLLLIYTDATYTYNYILIYLLYLGIYPAVDPLDSTSR